MSPLEALGVQIGQPADRFLGLFQGLTVVGQLVLDLDRQFEQRLRAAGHAVVDDVLARSCSLRMSLRISGGL